MLIAETDLQQVQKLHEQSQHLQAFNLAQSICPLPKWQARKPFCWLRIWRIIWAR
jgi:hypothetical protein